MCCLGLPAQEKKEKLYFGVGELNTKNLILSFCEILSCLLRVKCNVFVLKKPHTYWNTTLITSRYFFQNFEINFLCLKKQSLSWATCNPGYTWVSGPYFLYSLMSINRLMLDVVLIKLARSVRCGANCSRQYFLVHL
jgi:hypothetical protein